MDFDTEALKLAFSYHALEQIIAADGVLEPEELAFLEQTFPSELMKESGYMDDAGDKTPLYSHALDEALIELPDRLTLGEKLCIVEIFVDATIADGVFRHSESEVLQQAAIMLGVTTDEWSQHLGMMKKMWRSGD